MKKILAVLFIWTIFVVLAAAQDNDSRTSMTTQEATSGKSNVNVGPGMQAITIEGTSILVPKDMVVTKGKGQIIKEDIGAYLGRKFEEIGNRFDRIKAGQEEFKKELDELTQRVVVLEQQAVSKANATKGK